MAAAGTVERDALPRGCAVTARGEQPGERATREDRDDRRRAAWLGQTSPRDDQDKEDRVYRDRRIIARVVMPMIGRDQRGDHRHDDPVTDQPSPLRPRQLRHTERHDDCHRARDAQRSNIDRTQRGQHRIHEGDQPRAEDQRLRRPSRKGRALNVARGRLVTPASRTSFGRDRDDILLRHVPRVARHQSNIDQTDHELGTQFAETPNSQTRPERGPL